MTRQRKSEKEEIHISPMVFGQKYYRCTNVYCEPWRVERPGYILQTLFSAGSNLAFEAELKMKSCE